MCTHVEIILFPFQDFLIQIFFQCKKFFNSYFNNQMISCKKLTNEDLPTIISILTLLFAGRQTWNKQLHRQEVVGSDGAQYVLDHSLGARAQQVAELWRVCVY